MCYKHLTFVNQKHKPMKKLFLHTFHYPIMGWEVFDVRKMNWSLSTKIVTHLSSSCKHYKTIHIKNIKHLIFQY